MHTIFYFDLMVIYVCIVYFSAVDTSIMFSLFFWALNGGGGSRVTTRASLTLPCGQTSHKLELGDDPRGRACGARLSSSSLLSMCGWDSLWLVMGVGCGSRLDSLGPDETYI